MNARHPLSADLSATDDGPEVPAPFTGETLHRLPWSSIAEVSDAAAAARAAQSEWAARGHAERRRVLLAGHDLLLERRRGLLDLLQTETGKTRGQAFEELFQAASTARYYALGARSMLAPERRRSGIPFVTRARVDFTPQELVGVITPWNYPVALAAMDVLPALAAGSAVLHKADDQATLSVLMLRRAFVDAGLPADLWPVVTGPGDVIGSALIDAVDHVCFTGSTATGAVVAERAASRLIEASLELGGKNALLVLDGVDVEEAARTAAYACFAAAGQLCVSTERIFVEEPVADAFEAAFARTVRGLRLGAGLDYSADVGTLTTRSQFDRVRAHVDDALAHGARIVAGGSPRPELGPWFHEPTVLADVTAQMACFAEETFGPVVALTRVATAEEAVSAANSSVFGLNATVLGPRRRARAIATTLRAGSVNIGEGYRASFASVDAPMGGWGLSGLGRRNGREGIRRFTESRTVAETTGLLRLPTSAADFDRLTEPMVGLLIALRRLGRR